MLRVAHPATHRAGFHPLTGGQHEQRAQGLGRGLQIELQGILRLTLPVEPAFLQVGEGDTRLLSSAGKLLNTSIPPKKRGSFPSPLAQKLKKFC